MPNSIPISSLYILTAYIRVSNCFFLIFSKWFDVVHAADFFLGFMKFLSACALPKYVIHRNYEE